MEHKRLSQCALPWIGTFKTTRISSISILIISFSLLSSEWRLYGFLSKWLYEFLVHSTFCMTHPSRYLWFNNPNSDNYTGFVRWNHAFTWMHGHEFLPFCILLWVHMPIARPRSRNVARFYGRDAATRKTGDPRPWWFVAPYSHQQYNTQFDTVEWSLLAQQLYLLTYRTFRSNNLIGIYSNSWLCFRTLCTVIPVPAAERSKAFACWDRGFESRRGAWTFVCCECCVCCHVEVSVTSWPLVQGIPADCGASLCVTSKPHEWGARIKQPEPLGDAGSK